VLHWAQRGPGGRLLRNDENRALDAEAERAEIAAPCASAAHAVNGSRRPDPLNGHRAPGAVNGSVNGSRAAAIAPVAALAPSGSLQRAFDAVNGWAERIFVITLPRATDRQARVRERLAGLDFRFVHGVDKDGVDRAALVRDGTYDETRTRPAYRHTRDMSVGEIGAALAHRRVYEEVVRNGWRRVIVLEDDVVPLESSLPQLPQALGELPSDWDLCYLGYLKGEHVSAARRFKLASYVALSRVRLCRWKPHEVPRLRTRPFSRSLRRAGLHTHAHAYAVSLEGAKKLLAAQTPIAFRADSLLSWVVVDGGISGYVTATKYFEQERILGLTPQGAVPSYISG
jgi:glycosyl transferase, family 25